MGFSLTHLRNQTIAHIFATKSLPLIILPYFMRRDIFQAIADPTRRAILVLIAMQSMTPNAIAEHFDMSRQAISKHLKILAECDLLYKEKEGREIFYQLQIQKMKEIDDWLRPFRRAWESRFDQLDQLLSNIKHEGK